MLNQTFKILIVRILYTISRYLVGSIFIFSGGIKINDPVGTQIKLEEYFGVFSSDFHPIFEILIPFALTFSVILCSMEIIIGFALLMNYKMKVVSKITLSLIIFFTFLTFYSTQFLSTFNKSLIPTERICRSLEV